VAEILNAHGSKNDIFITAMTPRDFASDAGLRAFVRRLCDRAGPFGGDGIYLYDAAPAIPEAWFFNPDGSSAEFCGNGMRCLGRAILDLRGVDETVVESGSISYRVSRGLVTTDGVHQIRLEHPRVRFQFQDAAQPIVDLDPALTFTSVTVPNPHLIAMVDKYVESDLVAMGETIAGRPDLFPGGANLSVLLPIAADDVFVRTFERGAGLTASCGSGMVAARAAYSRLGHVGQDLPVTIHNAGGVALVWLHDWHPVLQGNATYVYRFDVDPSAPLPSFVEVEEYAAEAAAYSAFEAQNLHWQDTHITR
jgi:diaminopimelate epimerase